MATRPTHLWLSLCLVHVFTIASSRAQTLKPSLQIDTEDGKKTFHIGERIPLRLTFVNPEGKPYLVDREPCGSRYCEIFWKPEAFEVQPATGWSDPLATYFEQNFIWVGGRTSASATDKTTPSSARPERMGKVQRTGDYKVKITSQRFASSSAEPNASVAAAIYLHVVPASPEWQSFSGFDQFETLTALSG
jgi:hypothetical protein